MSYGYGGRQNPYGQGSYEPMRSDNEYNEAPYNQPAYGQPQPYTGYNQSVEMEPLTTNAGSMARANPNAILDSCRDIDRGIDHIEKNLDRLRSLQQRTLDDADSSSSTAANRELDSLSAETMAEYRSLTDRIRQIKSSPDAHTTLNSPHVNRIDRRLKAAITQYQQVESQFRKRTEEQMARQFRIIQPDASEQEVRRAVEDTRGGQVFQQAMMQSARQGRARDALAAVQDRHKALVKIEEQMMELSQLFQDLDTLVVQQEPVVMQIEQKGEEVVDHLDRGNEHMGVAVRTARATRKKKWICFGICVAIIAVIALVLGIYFGVVKAGSSSKSKRDIIDSRDASDAINLAPLQRMSLRFAARALHEARVAFPRQADQA